MVQSDMGYTVNSDHMANIYSMIWHTFRQTMKLFFHLTVLNSWILLLHVGLNIPSEISGSFWWRIGLKKLEKAKITLPSAPTPVGRQSAAAASVVLLESCHNQHWPVKSSTQLCCRLCSFRSQRKGTLYKNYRFHMGLGVVHSDQQKSIGLKSSKSRTEVTWHTVAIIIWVVLLSPYLCIRGVSLSSIHYNQSHRIYINRIQK